MRSSRARGTMSLATPPSGVLASNAPSVVGPLVPIMVVVLSGFLVTGLAMPVLLLHVQRTTRLR